jgi:two-component system, NarL family, nitrate/nitrite response regulator NarL
MSVCLTSGLAGRIGHRTHFSVEAVRVADTTSTHSEPEHPTRVLVVAEIRLYREGLAANLAARPHLCVLGKAGSADEARALQKALAPDIVVIDMGTRDSFELVRAFRRQDVNVRIIAYGVDESERDIVACAEAGVAGYLPCDGSIDDLVRIIASCTRGELICSPRIAATLFNRVCSLASLGHESTKGDAILTGRERQIVSLIDAGLSNKEIAQRLNIEVTTVKNHVHNILEKLHVTTRAEAAAWFLGRDARRSSYSVLDPALVLS